MLARTRVNRARLLADFDNWLAERGRSLDGFVTAAPRDVLGLNTALVAFGHELFDAGRPYWIYSETVNGVAATHRSEATSASWDLGFPWLAIEPYSHHVPLPAILLCAVLAACMVWGWTREAGLFAMAWGGLIGEATSAKRADLVPPGMCCTPRALFSCGSRSQKPGCVWRDTKLLESNHVTLLSSSTSSSRTSTQQSASGLGPADPSQARLGVVPREGHKLGSFRPGEQPTSSSRRRTLSSHDVVADGRVTRSWRFTYRGSPSCPDRSVNVCSTSLRVSPQCWKRQNNGMLKASRLRPGILYFFQKASIGGEVAGETGKFSWC